MRRPGNEPAFPRSGYYPPTHPGMDIDHLREMMSSVNEPQDGLTVRQLYAAFALIGLMANPAVTAATNSPRERASAAWSLADAMLETEWGIPTGAPSVR